MLCLRFSLLLILLFSFSAHARKFTSQACLESKFENTIKHDGKFFGLIKNNLTIKKDKCKIEVSFKNIIPTVWKIDICREPVHMKVTARGSQDVFKRGPGCPQGNKSEYCGYWKELKEKIQDYGLIYAEGEREFLNHAHGQTYCVYLLLKKYLEQAVFFFPVMSHLQMFIREHQLLVHQHLIQHIRKATLIKKIRRCHNLHLRKIWEVSLVQTQ
jgi:hypothetical protein